MLQKILLLSIITSTLLINSFQASAQAETGYDIKVKIQEADEEFAILANYVGVKQYIKDTLWLKSDGWYQAQSTDTLQGGLYMAFFPKLQRSFDILISNPESQKFTMETDTLGIIKNMKVTGSPENKAFNKYLKTLNEYQEDRVSIQKTIDTETDPDKQKIAYDKRDKIDEAVQLLQKEYIEKNKGFLSSNLLKGSTDVDVPSPPSEMEENEESDWRFYYYKEHFFDNIDFTDERLVRTPVYESRLMRYINKMLLPVPDSLYIDLNQVLEKTTVNEEVFRYTLITMVNHYAKSKIVGMDAVYVHLVDKYYLTGKAPWTDEETLKKMKKNVNDLRPLLIGKRAPNIQITELGKGKIQLHQVEAEYTVLYFWDPKCGHCNKVAPDLVAFSEEYKDQDIKIFSVCTKDKNDSLCLETIEKKGFTGFINTLAMEDRELYYRLNYAVKSTPIVYVLDKDKIIRSKSIGPAQIAEAIEFDRKRKANIRYGNNN